MGPPVSARDAKLVAIQLPESADLRYVAQQDVASVKKVIYEILNLDPNAPECRVRVDPPTQQYYPICFLDYTGEINALTCEAQLQQRLGVHYSYLTSLVLKNNGTMVARVKMLDPGRVNTQQHVAHADQVYAMEKAARKRARTGEGPGGDV